VAAPSPRASIGRRTVCGRTEQRRPQCSKRCETKVGPVWGSFLVAAAALKPPTRNGYTTQGVNLKFTILAQGTVAVKLIRRSLFIRRRVSVSVMSDAISAGSSCECVCRGESLRRLEFSFCGTCAKRKPSISPTLTRHVTSGWSGGVTCVPKPFFHSSPAPPVEGGADGCDARALSA